MLGDDARLRPVRGQLVEGIEGTVVARRIDPPEPGTTDIGDPRAELVAEQPEDAEDHVGVGAGVGHDLGRFKLGFLFQHAAQQHQAVT